MCNNQQLSNADYKCSCGGEYDIKKILKFLKEDWDKVIFTPKQWKKFSKRINKIHNIIQAEEKRSEEVKEEYPRVEVANSGFTFWNGIMEK